MSYDEVSCAGRVGTHTRNDLMPILLDKADRAENLGVSAPQHPFPEMLFAQGGGSSSPCRVYPRAPPRDIGKPTDYPMVL